jgi:penicillin-binding protein 2
MHSQRRLYPQDGLGAHVLGYVSEISDAELNQDEFMFYEPGAEIGKAGIERQYNDILTGTDGRRLVEVDSSGRERKLLGTVEAKPGRSIRLTLDLDLQVVAELAMNNRKGAVVALDPRSGEVLALVSRPTFDPNKFVGGISSEDWRRVKRDPDHPMMNRAIQAQLAPGSTFKPIVALAALEENLLDDDFYVLCTGGASFYSRYFRCHRRGGHAEHRDDQCGSRAQAGEGGAVEPWPCRVRGTAMQLQCDGCIDRDDNEGDAVDSRECGHGQERRGLPLTDPDLVPGEAGEGPHPHPLEGAPNGR